MPGPAELGAQGVQLRTYFFKKQQLKQAFSRKKNFENRSKIDRERAKNVHCAPTFQQLSPTLLNTPRDQSLKVWSKTIHKLQKYLVLVKTTHLLCTIKVLIFETAQIFLKLVNCFLSNLHLSPVCLIRIKGVHGQGSTHKAKPLS